MRGLEKDLGRRQARRKEDYRTALTALRSSASPKMPSFSSPRPVVAKDDHCVVESFHIFDDFMDRRKRLVKKNMFPTTYRDHFVSGEADPPGARKE